MQRGYIALSCSILSISPAPQFVGLRLGEQDDISLGRWRCCEIDPRPDRTRIENLAKDIRYRSRGGIGRRPTIKLMAVESGSGAVYARSFRLPRAPFVDFLSGGITRP